MTLGEILKDVRIIESNVNCDLEVQGIENDSRRVQKDTLFVAIKGFSRNGNEYVNEAYKRGAVAIITDDRYVFQRKMPYILVDSSREALATIWSNYYGNPEKDIKTVAITGTNGKTTSAYFLYNILRTAGISCALISTVECLINGEKQESPCGSVSDVASTMTTPEPKALSALYKKMKENGVKVAVIEASSHALMQHRLDKLNIEIGAFTNLSREHLDYHGSMEEYFKAKEALFKMCRCCVVNLDDEYGKILYERYREKAVGYSFERKAEFFAKNLSATESGCEYLLFDGKSEIKIETIILGKYNACNSLLSATCAKMLGIDGSIISRGIKSTQEVKGRMERYGNKQIYIDYAHTPAAMEKVISEFKAIKGSKRLIVLFGCGGNRDKGKRAEMGRICSSLADLTVVTSDNPRDEDPYEILNDILKGIEKEKEFMLIPKRDVAITVVAGSMNENDILLLLGKGHENYEINKKGKCEFDEREVLDRVFAGD